MKVSCTASYSLCRWNSSEPSPFCGLEAVGGGDGSSAARTAEYVKVCGAAGMTSCLLFAVLLKLSNTWTFFFNLLLWVKRLSTSNTLIAGGMSRILLSKQPIKNKK